MTMLINNLLGTRATLDTNQGPVYIYRLDKLEKDGWGNISRLPFSIKILLEAALREADGFTITREDVQKLASWKAVNSSSGEFPFKPARVILQDFSGVPAIVDLAAMRSMMVRMGQDPQKINPVVPAHLVIDHSVQVDVAGQHIALQRNMELEFERNCERYEFLRWGQQTFHNFSIVPPASGIIHQVNLEYLAKGVWTRPEDGGIVVYPDTVIGTDSHTPMINGLGIVGWGTGGIEAEAVMLGQPIYMLIPAVIGFRLTGQLSEGVTATDLTLTIVQMLRQKGVVGNFIEFYGPALNHIPVPDRATIANMAPEYGATMGFFPTDTVTLTYLKNTGRSPKQVKLVEHYLKEQGLFRTNQTSIPDFSDTLELDLSQVVPCIAGPKRPQDRMGVPEIKNSFQIALTNPVGPQGYGLVKADVNRKATINANGQPGREIGHGSVVLAAITSCTNTSNPSVMLSAGILAKKAVEHGLRLPPYIKASIAPGSKVVTEYLTEAGLTPYLEQLGFYTVGYGCTTCVGNSGPLPATVIEAISQNNLIVSGVLSGNRNFEGRIHAHIKANYLASPPLVIAYALAGTINIDLTADPIGKNKQGADIYLKDLWPTQAEISAEHKRVLNPDTFLNVYTNIEQSNPQWNQLPAAEGALYDWDETSTYFQEPPFFQGMDMAVGPIQSIEKARVLVKLGDAITTDHISPVATIPVDTPAGKYLLDKGVAKKDFNAYGARRGNDQVLTRGTFANIRLRNQLAPGTEGGWTTYLPSGEIMSIFDAAEKYKADNTPLLVIAGQEYGTGSARDWAAKGTLLLGVKAVLAQSFERIHRNNLVCMGVLPLQFKDGENAEILNLTGHESYTIHLDDNLKPGQKIPVTVTNSDGLARTFNVICRTDTAVEVDYYRNGGILPTVLRSFLK